MKPSQILNDCRQMEVAEAAAKEQSEIGIKGYRMSRLDEVATVIKQAVYDSFIRGFRQGVKQTCEATEAPAGDACNST